MYPKGSTYAPPPRSPFKPDGGTASKKPSGMNPMAPTPSSKLPPRAPSPEPKKTKVTKGALGSIVNYKNLTRMIEPVRSRGARGAVISEGDPAMYDPKGLKGRIVSFNPNIGGGKGTGTRKMSKADSNGQGAYINGRPAHINKRSK